MILLFIAVFITKACGLTVLFGCFDLFHRFAIGFTSARLLSSAI